MNEARRNPPDEFYVGYLPLPQRHARVLRVAVPAVLWGLVFVAIGAAWVQRDPGPAVWDDGTERVWEGVLHVAPYPMLVIADGEDKGVALLVQQGKRGAVERCMSSEARRVRVRGWRLERDGRRIIELSPESNAIEPLGGGGFAALELERGVRTDLTGEIVDSKCFLGAMKPGDGVGHKSCAMLCLRGGVPPMLAWRDERGVARYTLVLDQNGGPMHPNLIPLAGERVRVYGVFSLIGDLEAICVQEEGVFRRGS